MRKRTDGRVKRKNRQNSLFYRMNQGRRFSFSQTDSDRVISCYFPSASFWCCSSYSMLFLYHVCWLQCGIHDPLLLLIRRWFQSSHLPFTPSWHSPGESLLLVWLTQHLHHPEPSTTNIATDLAVIHLVWSGVCLLLNFSLSLSMQHNSLQDPRGEIEFR